MEKIPQPSLGIDIRIHLDQHMHSRHMIYQRLRVSAEYGASTPICLSGHADVWLQTHTVQLQISSTPLITDEEIFSRPDQYV